MGIPSSCAIRSEPELTAQRALRAERAAPVALVFIILGACLLATGSWRVYSNTWDEPEHLAAGIELLDRGRYEYDTEHPPLARVALDRKSVV